MRTHAAWIVAIGLILGSFSPLNADKEKPAAALDYFPLKVGSKWQYKMNAMGNQSKATSQIVKHETIDGVKLARLEFSIMDKVVATEHVVTNEKGIFRYRTNGLQAVPPIQMLKLPYEKGMTWKQDFMVGKEEGTIAGKMDEETVTVPAGKYKAITAQLDMASSGQKLKTTYWFAPGVGIVKQTLNLGGGEITLELESFEPGK